MSSSNPSSTNHGFHFREIDAISGQRNHGIQAPGAEDNHSHHARRYNHFLHQNDDFNILPDQLPRQLIIRSRSLFIQPRRVGVGEVNEIYEPRQTSTQESARDDLDRLDRPHQEATRMFHQAVDEEESFTIHAHNGQVQVHQEVHAHMDEQLFMTLLENEGLARIMRCRDAFSSRSKAAVPFLPNKKN
eukprot:CAMPEP_0196811454 /NCGR_PEP_ID=MMETSP1362-20130617/17670_1 /TAXON_ID=163516 /ORGANISM="Leptocylindrus danicus, Strain CCMP1856" /LENGTH=187 /DNA_ID=CAMNT_0042186751 /DNA_START=70 /DNA_END=633 /DNA_ORIENTATION=+